MVTAFVDNHCHSLLKDWDQALPQCFTESRSLEHVDALISFAHASAQARTAFGNQNVIAMIVDDGFAADRMLSLSDLQSTTNITVYKCKRMEPVIEKHLAQCTTVPELQKAVFEDLFTADCIALKTIMAYRGGLILDTVPIDEAAADFQNARHEFHSGRNRIERRPIYHYLLRMIFEAAGQHNLPVQIHSGLGDDDAMLIESNPALFQPVLKTNAMQSTQFVFLHCFPYVREAALLASLYANVYFDLSLAIPQLSPLASNLITEALAIAPTTKLLAGTDGHSHPAMHAYGAMIWRSALQEALHGLKQRGFVNDTACDTIEKRVLHENAIRLYRLSSLQIAT